MQSKIQHAAREMFYGRRVGELLNCLGELEVPLPYDVPMLLNRLFDYGDYHSFLKQAYRLRVKAGSEGNIAAAIEAMAKRAPIEAAAWQPQVRRPTLEPSYWRVLGLEWLEIAECNHVRRQGRPPRSKAV